MAYTQLNKQSSIQVKLLKSSAGGKDVFSYLTLNDVNTTLSDENAYLVGEGYGALTDVSPEEIIRKQQYTIASVDSVGGGLNG